MSSVQTGISTDTSTAQQSGVLPRLLYVGDVPVESSYHGSALLYRLFDDYPPGKLLLVESSQAPSQHARRLPGVPYVPVSSGADRLLNRLSKTRFSNLASGWLVRSSPPGVKLLRRALSGFSPDAVVTVAHGHMWLGAADFAAQLGVPLHLIVHDDWPTTVAIPARFRSFANARFGEIYRRAASRLCVSPFMEEEYQRRYGVAGQVLYPSRGEYDRPNGAPKTYSRNATPLTGAFAGNMFHPGYARLIVKLAERLERIGGRLLVFGPDSPESLKSRGLGRPNIFLQGLVSSAELPSRLQAEADFLFVPMAFEADGVEDNMRLSFPSKLTDYTATGLPLLIWGPAHCSAARWARSYAPVSELVTSEGDDEIGRALDRLGRASHREALGRAAMTIGDAMFSRQAARQQFYDALCLSGKT